MLSGFKTKVNQIVQDTSGSIIRLNKIDDLSHVDQYIRYTSDGYINNLDLVSPGQGISTVYKTMSTSLYALNQFTEDSTPENFYSILDSIIEKGGDVVTNCALAGALMGCELGYDELYKNPCKELFEIRPRYLEVFKKIEEDFFKELRN